MEKILKKIDKELINESGSNSKLMETAIRYNFNRKTGREGAFHAKFLCSSDFSEKKDFFMLLITANMKSMNPNIKNSTLFLKVDGKTIRPRRVGDAIESEYSFYNEGTYYEEIVPYRISRDELKTICDAHSVVVSYPNTFYGSKTLSTDFIAWCQCVYNETVDASAYPDAYKIIESSQKNGEIRNIVFWIVIIGLIIFGIILFRNDSFLGGLLAIIGAVVAIFIKYPEVGAIFKMFSGN